MSKAPSPSRAAQVPVTVNGDDQLVPVDCSLAALVEQLGLAGRRVAVAVNREVIPRSGFASRRLAEGDRVEILEAVGGG